MATNKKPFTFHISDKCLAKMKYAAKHDTRSLSNLLEHLCRLYIEIYELKYGEIEIENTLQKTDSNSYEKNRKPNS